jgi:putative ABC transport system ATP-binding protein
MAQFRAHRYGVVYQSSNWVESLNCIENVALPLLFLGVDERWAYDKARENLEIVGMENFATRDPKTLSGGQQQRVSLARSLVNNPWVIVADEPTGNLDSKAGNDVMQILYDLTKNLKRTVILVTHNLDYVILASQMIYIKDGKLSSREEALPRPITIKTN